MHLGECVVNLAVEGAAGSFFADTADQSIAFPEVTIRLTAIVKLLYYASFCVPAQVSTWLHYIIGCPLSPLLKQERGACGMALIAEGTGPVWVHGAGLGAGFAACYDPVDPRLHIAIMALPLPG